jgi:hypothetical protein
MIENDERGSAGWVKPVSPTDDQRGAELERVGSLSKVARRRRRQIEMDYQSVAHAEAKFTDIIGDVENTKRLLYSALESGLPTHSRGPEYVSGCPLRHCFNTRVEKTERTATAPAKKVGSAGGTYPRCHLRSRTVEKSQQ